MLTAFELYFRWAPPDRTPRPVVRGTIMAGHAGACTAALPVSSVMSITSTRSRAAAASGSTAISTPRLRLTTTPVLIEDVRVAAPAARMAMATA